MAALGQSLEAEVRVAEAVAPWQIRSRYGQPPVPTALWQPLGVVEERGSEPGPSFRSSGSSSTSVLSPSPSATPSAVAFASNRGSTHFGEKKTRTATLVISSARLGDSQKAHQSSAFPEEAGLLDRAWAATWAAQLVA